MLTTYHHPVPLLRNLGALTSWIPLGLSRPVMGLLFTHLRTDYKHDIFVHSSPPPSAKIKNALASPTAVDWCKDWGSVIQQERRTETVEMTLFSHLQEITLYDQKTYEDRRDYVYKLNAVDTTL